MAFCARIPYPDPDDPRGFAALAARYHAWMAVRGCSESTRRASDETLRIFAAWCAERSVERPGEVTRAVLERFQRHLHAYRKKNGKPLSIGTQHQRVVRLRSFFQWLAREQYLAADPASGIEAPRLPPRLPTDGFTVAEVEQILAHPDVADPVGLRDRAMLETFYATGIRRSELAALDLYDLDPERMWLTIRHGKGGKKRVVPVGERALSWVSTYLERSRPVLVAQPDESALYLTAYGTRFPPGALGIRVRQLIRDSGVRLRTGSCHLFRHTCATLMLEGGADTRFLQEMLGHASLETTQIYTRVSIQKLQEIHAATHPGAKLERKVTTERAALLAALEAEADEESDTEDDATARDPS